MCSSVGLNLCFYFLSRVMCVVLWLMCFQIFFFNWNVCFFVGWVCIIYGKLVFKSICHPPSVFVKGSSCLSQQFDRFLIPLPLLQMKIPSKKMAHIPVYTVGFHTAPKSHGHKTQVYKWVFSSASRRLKYIYNRNQKNCIFLPWYLLKQLKLLKTWLFCFWTYHKHHENLSIVPIKSFKRDFFYPLLSFQC